MAVDLVAERFRDTLAQELTRRPPMGVKLYWLGQAGFVVDAPALRLVIDPYLSDSLAEKYRGTRFPHVRMVPAPIEPATLHGVDLVLCTHQHTDHMDPVTLKALAAANPRCRFLVPAASLTEAERRIGESGERILTIDAGETLAPLPGLAVTATRAAHETLERDDQGRHRFLGYALGLEGATIWHSGDGVPFDGLADEARSLAPDVALMPVNGRDETRAAAGVPGNFHLDEAAALKAEIGVPHLLAHHYGLFDFNTEDPARIDAVAARHPGMRRAETEVAYRLLAT